MNLHLTSGARRLRRFTIRCLKAFEQGTGVNAALQFKDFRDTREIA